VAALFDRSMDESKENQMVDTSSTITNSPLNNTDDLSLQNNSIQQNDNINDVIKREVNKAIEHLRTEIKNKDAVIASLKNQLNQNKSRTVKSQNKFAELADILSDSSESIETKNKKRKNSNSKSYKAEDFLKDKVSQKNDLPQNDQKTRKRQRNKKQKSSSLSNEKSQNDAENQESIQCEPEPMSCQEENLMSEDEKCLDNVENSANQREIPKSQNKFDLFKNIKLSSNKVPCNEVENSEATETIVEETQTNKIEAKGQLERKVKYCPPIVLYNAAVNDISQSLGKNVDITECKIVNVNRKKNQIICKRPSYSIINFK
jgi:hypothetical protein